MFKFISSAISFRMTRGTVVVVLPSMSQEQLESLLRPIRRRYIYTRLLDGGYEVIFSQQEFIAACFLCFRTPDVFD